jgi:hypothetical protein
MAWTRQSVTQNGQCSAPCSICKSVASSCTDRSHEFISTREAKKDGATTAVPPSFNAMATPTGTTTATTTGRMYCYQHPSSIRSFVCRCCTCTRSGCVIWHVLGRLPYTSIKNHYCCHSHSTTITTNMPFFVLPPQSVENHRNAPKSHTRNTRIPRNTYLRSRGTRRK